MSYQREPSLQQIGKAVKLAKKGSLIFTGCSNYISDQIKTAAEVYTVYNCAPFEHYSASPSIADDAPLIFLGRIEPIKGTHIAVEVAERLNKKLIIAGNIPQEWQPYFDESIKPHLTDRIQYVGPVNDQQKNAQLKEALAFLMPIEWNEPFGIVMAEAMACGVPVLGFPKGSVPEVIDEGVTGFICSDVEAMIANVKRCSSLDRLRVRREAEKRFSTTKIVNDYLDLYNMMVKRNK
jgi:glycosyltransferase involved in cell wall biosynthesis